ncbi:MAG: hypothetical protein PHU29_00070 [Sulfuricurvum sp.]|uniref:hypothetical protein n=1 Tax=Sulfuricurvum sp. TaxID=2025608 RepID=UPI0026125959|nr:hypothetical protein [Sulfuricurvum sp.]MDD2949158.1 hypothetical protein [Sulfuricurvum sp.]MDD5118765.1 hypothetical protein [Sulfuricurvum sp.]
MKTDLLPFEEAREFVRSIELKNAREWKLWSKGELPGKEKRPDFIPSNPDVIYKRMGWLGWSDWIKDLYEVQYLPFEEAREFVRAQELKNIQEWVRYYQGKISNLQKPENIPWNPQKIYESDWQGIKDWLGVQWRDFEEAREFVRNLGLSGQTEWRAYCQGNLTGHEPKPKDIPTDPTRVYEDEQWVDMADWLGTQRKRKGNNESTEDTWLPYSDAKKFVHSLKLNGYDEWREYIEGKFVDLPKKPVDIPKSPQYVYKNDGWINWADWIGINSSQHIKIDTYENVNSSVNTAEYLQNLFTMDEIIKSYGNATNALKLVESIFVSKSTISLIELDVNANTLEEIENILFGFREHPSRQSPIQKAFIGLIFLLYVVFKLKDKFHQAIWKAIVDDLKIYHSVTTFFLETYFMAEKHPNYYLKEAIDLACKTFNLRNDFVNKDEHQYLRNTILLQIGIPNEGFENLKMWLSNYKIPIVLTDLLDQESENYSNEFHEGWRAIRRYRDNVVTPEQLKSILKTNVWFKYINLDELLKAAKQKNKKQMLVSSNENLEIFYLEKIQYDEFGLNFVINIQDTYMLNLGGYRYDIYIDDEYAGLLIANAEKNLTLENPLIISNPLNNRVNLEIRNEDNEAIYSLQIVLFDFSEQLIIFDEDGNIHSNIFKKLNSTKKYFILMDTDLDCTFNHDNQREYFEGYATLIPDIRSTEECKIMYNDEFLFELNFSETIQKPDFFDEIVLYTTAERAFNIDEDYMFVLKQMIIDPNTDEVELMSIPKEVEILKWTYSGGYTEKDDIDDFSIRIPLYAEMITFPKHTLMLKYNNKVFKKVVYCNFFEKIHMIRLFEINRKGDTRQIGRNEMLKKNDLKNNRYFLSDLKHGEALYLKNKSYFYQKVFSNSVINFGKLSGFGESIFVSEHLYNAELIELFQYQDTEEYIYLKEENNQILYFYKNPSSLSKLIILDSELNYHIYMFNEIESTMSNQQCEFDFEIVSCLMLSGSHAIDSCYRDDLLTNVSDINYSKIMKNLLVTNYIFLGDDTNAKNFRKFVLNNPEDTFILLYSDTLNISGHHITIDFSKQKMLLEHIFMSLILPKDIGEKVLQSLILGGYENKLLETPIILFNMLRISSSKRLTSYFYGMVEEAEITGEIDESFVQKIVDYLFDTAAVKSRDKHNLKVAMHYINGNYYLKKALEELLNG